MAGNEVKEKNRHGSTRFYIDSPEIRTKNRHGQVEYYIDGTLTRDQLEALISII